MNDLREEIDAAKDAILNELVNSDFCWSMPELVDELAGFSHREDAVRMAFWSLVQDGQAQLTKDFKMFRWPSG